MDKLSCLFNFTISDIVVAWVEWSVTGQLADNIREEFRMTGCHCLCLCQGVNNDQNLFPGE